MMAMRRLPVCLCDLTATQRQILVRAYKVGGIHRINRLWSDAPTAVHALIRQGYLAMNGTNFAQITWAGIALVERSDRREI
jgi:hypothetical protein